MHSAMITRGVVFVGAVCVMLLLLFISLPNVIPSKKIVSSRIDWDYRFAFVPNNVEKCTELFNGNGHMSKSFMEKFEIFSRNAENITKNNKINEGYTAQVLHVFKAYLKIASHPSVKTICETGFNAGHSTFGWLESNPNARVFTFDIASHPYTMLMEEHIHKLYPGRLHMTWGDSRKTLPDFRREHPDVTCDVMIIDGGHTTKVCQSDFLNFKEMATDVDNVLILDNYPQKAMGAIKKLGDVWEWAKRNGEIMEVFNCETDYTTLNGNLIKDGLGFSAGRYPTRK